MNYFHKAIDDNGSETEFEVWSGNVNALSLSANTSKTDVPPTDAKYVVVDFSAANLYVKIGTSASISVPAADNATGSSPHLNRRYYMLGGATAVNVVSPNAGIVTLSYYK